eukprot:SAG11_NODE_42509_length_179_cov_25.812500_1_plen_21_part_10
MYRYIKGDVPVHGMMYRMMYR